MTKMECSNVVGNEISSMQKCLNLFSQLSNDELKILSQKIEEEQNARENKKKQELINKAVAALHDLQQAEYLGCISITCDGCGSEMCLTLDEIAEKIKYDLE